MANYQAGSNPFGGAGAPQGGASEDAQYAALLQDTTDCVQRFSKNVMQLTKLVQGIGTSRDDVALRNQVHELIQTNKELAKETSVKLKRMAVSKTRDAREQQNRRVVQSRLAHDFQVWGQKFQEISTLDLNKERKDMQDHHDFAPARGYEAAEQDARARYQQQQEQTVVLAETALNEQIMRERNAAIREVETDILEVNEIFQDLAVMVHEQGLQVDNIESNVSTSAVAVEEGVGHLEKADEYQQKARKRCLIIAIIVTVVIAVLVVIILKAINII